MACVDMFPYICTLYVHFIYVKRIYIELRIYIRKMYTRIYVYIVSHACVHCPDTWHYRRPVATNSAALGVAPIAPPLQTRGAPTVSCARYTSYIILDPRELNVHIDFLTRRSVVHSHGGSRPRSIILELLRHRPEVILIVSHFRREPTG